MKTMKDFPGLKEVLNECQAKVQEIVGHPVTVSYQLKFHLLTTDLLAAIVCDVCEVQWKQIMASNRTTSVKIARQLFCYFAVTVQKKMLHQVAEVLQQDHTTIIHSRSRVQAMIDTQDELYMPLFYAIEKRINEIMMPV